MNFQSLRIDPETQERFRYLTKVDVYVKSSLWLKLCPATVKTVIINKNLADNIATFQLQLLFRDGTLKTFDIDKVKTKEQLSRIERLLYG